MSTLQQVIAGYTLIKDLGAYSNKTLFQVKKDNHNYAMKIFKPQQKQHFQQQSNILQTLKHPNIIKMIQKIIQIPLQSQFLYQKMCKCDIIITEMISYGNICDCLEKIRFCNEDVTRTLIKQLVEALLYSKDKNIIHGPVKGYDILIDQNRNVKLSGWAQSQSLNDNTLRNLVFSIGEIIVLMLTGHPPFVKHNANDALYKFIHPEKIEKFWDCIAKRIKQKLPDEVIELVKSIFLNKSFTLQNILNSQWIITGKILQSSDIKTFFKERQQQFKEKADKKKKQISAQKKKFQKIREQMKMQQVRSTENDEEDSFITDYNQCNLMAADLSIRQWCPEAIQIKQKISFIYAWIKKIFKDALLEKNPIIFPTKQVYLGKQQITLEQNQLIIKVQFLNYSQEQSEESKCLFQENENDIGQFIVRIQFYKSSQLKIYGIVTIDQGNAQWENQFYIKKLKRFIQNELKVLCQNFDLKNHQNDNKKQQQNLILGGQQQQIKI